MVFNAFPILRISDREFLLFLVKNNFIIPAPEVFPKLDMISRSENSLRFSMGRRGAWVNSFLSREKRLLFYDKIIPGKNFLRASTAGVF